MGHPPRNSSWRRPWEVLTWAGPVQGLKISSACKERGGCDLSGAGQPHWEGRPYPRPGPGSLSTQPGKWLRYQDRDGEEAPAWWVGDTCRARYQSPMMPRRCWWSSPGSHPWSGVHPLLDQEPRGGGEGTGSRCWGPLKESKRDAGWCCRAGSAKGGSSVPR